MNELEIKLLDVMGIVPELSTTAEINQGIVIINQVQTMTTDAKMVLESVSEYGKFFLTDVLHKKRVALVQDLVSLGFVDKMPSGHYSGYFYSVTNAGAMAVKLIQSNLM